MEYLTLGETSLDDYFKNPEPLSSDRKRKVSDLLARIEKDNVNIEQFPRKMLRIELAEYPILDLSFLSMNSPYQNNGNQIFLPRFGVFKSDGTNFKDFHFGVQSDRDPFIHSIGIVFSPGIINTSEGCYLTCETHFPDIVQDPLINSLEFSKMSHKDRSSSRSYFFHFGNKKIWKKYRPDRIFKSSFSGVLPDDARKELNEAKSIFGDELYLIAELKPEDWDKKRVFQDSLLIGLIAESQTAYLIKKINHSSITPLSFENPKPSPQPDSRTGELEIKVKL